MGLFSKLKNLFRKSVGLKEKDRTELVHFYHLKKGQIKVGTEVSVDDNYMAVIVHGDKVCDVLLPGKHIFNDVGMPLLNKCNKPIKTRKGYVTPKSIQADIYYVNNSPVNNIPFKSQKIKAIHNGKKTKVRLIGTYTVKVEDAKKLIKTLLLDMAVIKRGVALNEVNASIKYAITDVLEINVYTLDEYLKKDAKIIELLDSYISKKISDYGVSVTNVALSQVISYLKKEKLNKEQTDPDAVDVDNLCKKLEKQEDVEQITDEIPVLVTVGASEKNQESNANTRISTDTPSFESTYNEYLNEVRTQNEDLSEPEPQIIKDDENSINIDNQDTKNLEQDKIEQKDVNLSEYLKSFDNTILKSEENNINSISPNDDKNDDVQQDLQNRCKKCGTTLAKNAKFCYNCGCSTSEYKICPCCGAKNFQDATECITCKSKLD